MNDPVDPNDPFGGALPPVIGGAFGTGGERVVGEQRLFKIGKWLDTGFRYRWQLELIHGTFAGSETARLTSVFCERKDFGERFPGMTPQSIIGRTIRLTLDRDELVIPEEEFTSDGLI